MRLPGVSSSCYPPTCVLPIPIMRFGLKQDYKNSYLLIGRWVTQNWRSCQPQARRGVVCKRPWRVFLQAAVDVAHAGSPRDAAGQQGQGSPAYADEHSALMLLQSATRGGTQLQKQKGWNLKHDYKYFLFARQGVPMMGTFLEISSKSVVVTELLILITHRLTQFESQETLPGDKIKLKLFTDSQLWPRDLQRSPKYWFVRKKAKVNARWCIVSLQISYCNPVFSNHICNRYMFCI